MLHHGSLLERRDAERTRSREAVRLETRARLRAALVELLPGVRVLVFGSLSVEGRFSERSDVDIGLEAVPEPWSPYGLAAEVELRVGRPVDLVVLPECRFAEKLRREGEWWTT